MFLYRCYGLSWHDTHARTRFESWHSNAFDDSNANCRTKFDSARSSTFESRTYESPMYLEVYIGTQDDPNFILC